MILLAGLVAAVAVVVALLVVAVRRHRTPAELRGDWWSQFERDFRSYAACGQRPSGPARWYRRDDTRSSPGGG